MKRTDAPIFTVSEVLEVTGGELLAGELPATFDGISTDSRQMKSRHLFVALAGGNFNGHDFLTNAVEGGATGLLVQNEEKDKLQKIPKGVCVISVTDTLKALGDLAHAYRMRFSIPVIALTGSSGKTTTKEMIAAILESRKNVLKTVGNLNNLIGLPQTIFRLQSTHDIAVLEMGTNTRGEIKRLTQIASPDIGLITNIGPAHLAGLGSIEAVRQEKGDLFMSMDPTKTVVVNLDDESVRMLAQKWSGRRLTYSMTSNADVSVKDIRQNGAKGVIFNLVACGQERKIEMRVAGIHNIYNAMAACGAAMAAGCDLETVCQGLTGFQPVAGRMEVIRLSNGAYVINDAYNANPASVREALMTLKDLKGTRSAFVFLGDMLELGYAAPEMHRKIGLLLAATGVSAAYLQGDFAQMTAAGAYDGGLPKEKVMILKDDDEAIASLKVQLRKGDWILVKGSRRMRMDRLVTRFCEVFGRRDDSLEKTIH